MQQSREIRQMSTISALKPFRGKPLILQLATVVYGLGLGVCVYVLTFYLTGQLNAVVGVDAASMTARKQTSIIVSICAGVYFGVMYTRALGGPVLNLVSYVLTIVFVQPFTAYALTDSVFELGYGIWRFSAAFYTDWITIMLPGVILMYGIITVWENHILEEDERQEWQQRHYPEAFRFTQEEL